MHPCTFTLCMHDSLTPNGKIPAGPSCCCKLQTYPLSRAGTNCPSRAAMTRAAPLLSKVPCCRRFFINSDMTNSAPVMPVTRPAGRTCTAASQDIFFHPEDEVDQTCHVLRPEQECSPDCGLSLGHGKSPPLRPFRVDQMSHRGPCSAN